MNLKTISRVSKNFNISTRTLRYYEEIGLIQSIKMEGYAYRTYDEKSIMRLEQIILLRKLRIPLKQIQLILLSEKAAVALEVFKEKISELSDEITALSTIRSILNEFITRLKDNIEVKVNPGLLADEALIKIIDSLTVTKINFKEDLTMNDLNAANQKLSKLTDVRIVYLPPSTVASSQCYCEDPEYHATKIMEDFVRKSNLCSLKPDLRHYGFNNPCFESGPPEGMPDHGYEMWVTIPEDMEVPEPLTKKFFPGGLYAAHMIKMGDFHEWQWLIEWVKNNDIYEPNWGDPTCMGGLLEECLNYINHVRSSTEFTQLDLLMPIKLKEKK